jgi:hypothetical protein
VAARLADDDAAQPLLQVIDVHRKANDRHHLGTKPPPTKQKTNEQMNK